MPTLAIYGLAGLALLTAGFLGGWEVRGWKDDAALLKVQQAQTAALVKAAEDARALGVAEGQITFTAGQKAAEENVRIVTRVLTQVRQVPINVPKTSDDACQLRAGFVRLHDAAARGDDTAAAISGASGSAIDTPASTRLSDVASTVIVNYGKYYQVANELIALQGWVKQQQALHK